MLGYLKQHHPWSSTCGSSTSSLSAWREESFGKFSIYGDYKDLRDLNTGFDSFESLDLLSASQVAQLTLHSGALHTAHLMEMVFARLEGGNSFQDVEEFLEALSRSAQDLDINPVVRDIMMNRTFTIISLQFADFLSYDWVSWFTVKLVPLLPSLTAEMLQTVTANTDCNAYHVIVGALSSVFGQMTSLRQQELTQVMLGYLKQHHPWSSTCGSSTSSLSAWLEERFGKFSIYVDYKDLRDLNTGFDSFESLDLLSASQVAQLTLHSGALNNAHLMEMVFDRLEGGNSFQDVEEFLEALSRSSQDLDINPVVRDIMMNRTFTIISLHFADFLSYDWVSWFTVKLVPLLPSLTAEGCSRPVTANTDWQRIPRHVPSGALSSVFGQLTSLETARAHPIMLGTEAAPPWSKVQLNLWIRTSSSVLWLEEAALAKFSTPWITKTCGDLTTCFDRFESLDLLSASQVAQLTLHSGALNNAHLMEMVFDRLEGGNSFQDVEEFLEALSRSSQDLDINPVVRDIMMNRTFAIISLHFADFLRYDWVSWFTVKLVPLLPSLTAEMLQTVTANTDCNAYHVIVGALSSVFGQMTSLRQQELTQVMLGYLKQHHPWSSTCGSSTSSLSAWLEESFGKFSIYVDYKDLHDLNTGFDSFESLDLLSASQVAQLTLHSGALNNAHLMEMVFDRLEGGNSFQEVEEFLEALSRSSQDLDINPVVRDIMLNRTFAIISLHFADFLSYDWVSWFTVKLVPLLPSLTAEMLQTVTANTDCNAYHVIVGALSSVFGQMTSLRQQELTQVMLGYLKQHHPWSSTCESSTSSLSAWLEESFGKFSIYVDYKDLRDLNTGFDSFESLDLLSASQVAQLTLHSGALNNAHLMEMVFDRLEGSNSFQDVEEFLEALSRSSQDLDINPVVRDIMMNRTFTIISLHFADSLSYDWVSWFTVKLVPLLPSLTAEMLQTVTANTDCNAYHVMYVALRKCRTAL
ncbi:putative threonine-rich GPI-anchored glyco isoform X2 [Labeo rohita]|uniref:Putative threonine-rich GPI-anchored glyco isoform X2 n=1 Tax=Labeo rohita TaxID=84645 RepID=A0A498N675_LABRO|nr:putative threonine-rich GPI-anchored glyco isoform X2 [Labeo rohita]